MKDQYTHITLVVDRSGSMNSPRDFRDEAEAGINRFIKEQKAFPGEATFLLVQFDDVHEDVFGPDNMDKHEGDYKLAPRSMTALWDAFGKGINRTGDFLTSLPEADRPGKVLFVVVTDGGENSSHEFNQDSVKKMVETQTNEFNWQFVFLAANIDAFGVGHSMGVKNTGQHTNSGRSMGATYSVLSANTTAYRGGGINATMAAMPDINTDGKVWDDAKKEWVDPVPSSNT